MATDFDININKFRNAEVLDQDNYYNREAQRLAVEQLKIWSGKEEEKKSPLQLTPQDKAKLDKYINRFENAIADKLYDFETEDTNETMTLPKEIIPVWNELVIWFSLNLGIRYKLYLDENLATEQNIDALKQLADYGAKYETRDATQLLQLYNNLRGNLYQRIPYAYTNITENEDERIESQAKRMLKTKKRGERVVDKANDIIELEIKEQELEIAKLQADLNDDEEDVMALQEAIDAIKEKKAQIQDAPQIQPLQEKQPKRKYQKKEKKEGGGRGLPRINYQQQYGEIMPPDFLDTPNNMASSNPSKVSAGIRTAGSVRPDFTLAGFN
jgi:hypothetical protein